MLLSLCGFFLYLINSILYIASVVRESGAYFSLSRGHLPKSYRKQG